MPEGQLWSFLRIRSSK